MTDRPRRYVVRSSDDRAMAAALIADGSSMAVELDEREGLLRVQTVDSARFRARIRRCRDGRGKEAMARTGSGPQALHA